MVASRSDRSAPISGANATATDRALNTLTDQIVEALAAADHICAQSHRGNDPQLPTAGGAYLLALMLPHPIRVNLSRAGCALLSSGPHVYVGSAWGPGGIRARVHRHLRKTKSQHWQIDQLTMATEHIAAVIVPGGSECALGRLLLRSNYFKIAARGFGNADCRACESHLFTVT